MENLKHGEGSPWSKFLERWGMLLPVLIAFIVSLIFWFFKALNGTSWICLLITSIALMVFGGGLVGYAKVPVCRSEPSVPVQLTGPYRWGLRLLLFGVVLGICLLFSKA